MLFYRVDLRTRQKAIPTRRIQSLCRLATSPVFTPLGEPSIDAAYLRRLAAFLLCTKTPAQQQWLTTVREFTGIIGVRRERGRTGKSIHPQKKEITMTPQTILDHWFSPETQPWWLAKSDAFDADIRARFADIVK